MDWEEFTSEEEENRAERLGIKPKDVGLKLVSADEALKAVRTGADMVRKRIVDPLDMQEVLKVRAAGHALLNIVSQETYRELNELCIKNSSRAPAGEDAEPDAWRDSTV